MASLRNRSLLFRILQQARPCWLRLTGIAVLGLLSIPLALLFPLPLKIAVDSVLGHQPLPAFMSMSWVSPSSAGALVLATEIVASNDAADALPTPARLAASANARLVPTIVGDSISADASKSFRKRQTCAQTCR